MGLRKELQEAAQKHAGTNKKMVARKDFDHAMVTLNFEDSDVEIFDRLFTLFDKTGAGKVNYHEVVISLAPLVPGTLNDRLILAFELCDDEGKGFVDKAEMLFTFKALNQLCNFLGDPTMELETLEELVESLFISTQDTADLTEAFGYADNVSAIAEHPLFEAWLRKLDEEKEEGGGAMVVGGGGGDDVSVLTTQAPPQS